MKRILTISIFVCLIICISSIIPANNVGPGVAPVVPGSTYTRGTIIVGPDQTYTNIQDAIDDSAPGDTVRIYAGTYYERIVLDKKLTLVGNGTSETVINGGNGGDVITIDADWCKVTGFKITKAGAIYSSHSGVRILSDNNTLENCDSSGNHYGFNFKDTETQTFKNCTSNSCFKAFYFSYSYHNTFINCVTNNNYYGYQLHYSHDNKIIDAEASSNHEAIHLKRAKNNIIEGCDFSSSDWSAIGIWFSSNNTMANCSFDNNIGNGIEVLGLSADINTFSNCTFNSNQDNGIFIWGGAGTNTLDNCTFQNNEIGINMLASPLLGYTSIPQTAIR
jgi:parallel beta-helix repeat protein